MADGRTMLLISLFLHVVFCCGLDLSPNKKKGKIKIVEEPASYHGMGNSIYHFQPAQEKALKTRVKPWKVSGPQHLLQLAGKCFSLINEGYKYEFCPFHNTTQREQAARWNSFSGVLGVWKQWVIENNTFEAMLMTEGDLCVGNEPRETKIVLKCGKSNTLKEVTEPTTCKYRMIFLTPQACPMDALLVYPSLSKDHKAEWEEIERDYYREELTFQGYNKQRNKLFIKAGFVPSPQDPNDKKEEDKIVERLVNDDRSIAKSEQNKIFLSTGQCTKAYEELLAEVVRLRKLVNLTVNLNSTQTNTNEEDESNVVYHQGLKGKVATLHSNGRSTTVPQRSREQRHNMTRKTTLGDKTNARTQQNQQQNTNS